MRENRERRKVKREEKNGTEKEYKGECLRREI